MTNSTEQSDPEAIIEEIVELISEPVVRELIDEPIDAAAASFTPAHKQDVTRDEFVEAASRLVQQIYRSGLPLHQELSDLKARTETIGLIETGYQWPERKGFDAAYLDARADMGAVLAQLCELIKEAQRKRYIGWVFSSRIERLDWQFRRRMVESLFTGEYHLPPRLTSRPPALFAGQLPELIKAIRDARCGLQKQLRSITESSAS